MNPIEPPARLAFVGLGVMGHAMAANLLKAGFPLAVHSRTRKDLPGADWANSAAAAARGAACIGLCVPDTPDVERVLFGAGGIAEGAAPGSVVIDFSTISAAATQGFAQRLAAQGVTLLDSPVSGGPQGADGTLTCMVGGDEAAFAATRAVFAAVGRTITRLGGPGAGQVCKAANQLMIAGTMHAVFEALVMGRKAGLDPRVMRQALLGGSAQSAVLANHALRWMDERFTPG
ncbi:MAG: NAD(P)-dependent oxidoreductase, partial [Alphaproteobacteria bacterium]|nr:NAD(P)-dependent oxidoreductase [Alphaproteobacteria bacterium]